MKMKKWICFAMAVFLLFLCGCGKKEEPKSTTQTTTQTATSNTVTVTFPEGKTVLQIANLLEENGVCAADDFIEAAKTSEHPIALLMQKETDRPFLLEGYVFPDTYEFYKNESAASALSRFLNNADRRITEAHKSRAAELGLTMDEVLTLASIIQKEAGIQSEMSHVSAVLHNRLKTNMRLDCDVTYFYLKDSVMPYYCGEEWDDAVYEKYADLYYTYRFRGLPEGPICNPGVAAIEAALYPLDSEDVYFFTDSAGGFHYAKEYSEHQAAYDKAWS